MLYMIVATVHIASCIFLIVVVLLQSGKDAGLSGAFGMGGGGQTIFGARAGDVLSKATIVIAVTFICTCLLFTRIQPSGAGSVVTGVLERGAQKELPGRTDAEREASKTMPSEKE